MKDKSIYKCKFCEKECIGNSGLHFHENRCNKNPNAVKYVMNVKLCIVHNDNEFKKIHLDELNTYLLNGWKRGYGVFKKTATFPKEKYMRITNGNINKYILQNTKIPDGWRKGITFHKSTGKCLDPVKEQERRKKISETCKINKKSGGYRTGSGHGKKGWYKGIFCDSTWELAYVIYCLDHNVNIERNKQLFDYEYNGEVHKYLPDFVVEGQLVEVKGWKDQKWKAKEKKFNNIKIIDKNEIQKYIDYVKQKYNCKDLADMYDSRNKLDNG